MTGFCRAHRTVDHPPRLEFGSSGEAALPPELRAVGADRWRCLNGQVLVCADTADGDQCGRKVDDPLPPVVAETCRELGDSRSVPFYAGHPFRYDWACRGGRAVVTQSYALDRRGFFKAAWARLVVRRGVVIAPKAAPDVLR